MQRATLRRIILSAIKTGPKTTLEVASALQAAKPELGDREAYASLKGTRERGVVVRERKAWELY